MDSLLSHEAMGEDLWMTVEWRSCDSNTMEDVARPNLMLYRTSFLTVKKYVQIQM